MLRASTAAICLLSVGLPTLLYACSSSTDDGVTEQPDSGNPGNEGGSTDNRLGDPPASPPPGNDASGHGSTDSGGTDSGHGGHANDAGSPGHDGGPPAIDAGHPPPPPPGDAGGGGVKDSGPPSSDPGSQVCARWRSDRQDMSEGAWSGNVAACNAGDIAANGRDNTIKLLNLYRYIAGLPGVTHDATLDAQGQQCALMMTANNALNHNPPTSWACYSQEGHDGAGQSNIASTPAVSAVDLYMADPGNDTTIGHRRWILSNSLGPVGIGSTDKYSCLHVFNGTGNANKPWTAWPPPGPFPSGALHASFDQLDKTGWSIQSDNIDFANAVVTITDGGANMPVTTNVLGAWYGAQYAIRIVPNGWTSQKGHTYSVNVTGVSQPISYQVQIVDCD